MDSDEKQLTIDPKKVPWWTSLRLALAIIGFLGFVNLYALRINLSVAMVCMINQTAVLAGTVDSTLPFEFNQTLENRTSGVDDGQADDVCSGTQRNGNGTKTVKEGELEWSKEVQGIILGSFFWGYLLTQILGGWLAENFGGKHVLGWSMFAAALATLLTPVGAMGSPYILVVLRIIIGLGEGVVFPSMHCLWSKWAPTLERSRLIGFTYAGAQIGNVLTLPISGLLCDYGFAGGWPSIFYVFGTFGVLWFIGWLIIVSDSPAQSKRISDIERQYIQSSIGSTEDDSAMRKRKHLGTPWKSIFTSLPVWAIIVGHTCSNWGTYTLLTNIPSYMREVLKFDIKKNGLLSAIPYVAFWACINIGGHLADTMRSRGWETGLVRKISLSIGTFLPGIFLVGTGYVPCSNPYIAVGVLTLAVGLSGFQYSGVMVNHVDIAPPFAGILFGVSNTAATLPGILAPYAIGRLTTHQTQREWQIVFYVAAAIYFIGGIFYIVFAKGHLQDWAVPYMAVRAEEGKAIYTKKGDTADVQSSQAK